MFKVNNKDTVTAPLGLFWCLYCYFRTYFTPCSSVSNVNFKHVLFGCEKKHHFNVSHRSQHVVNRYQEKYVISEGKNCSPRCQLQHGTQLEIERNVLLILAIVLLVSTVLLKKIK